jgi:hypothetical protein
MNIIRCPEEALSADFGDIVIDSVAENLDFRVTLNQEAILLETCHPDNTGHVYIRDVAGLAEIYRQEHSLSADGVGGTVTFSLEFKEGAQSLTRTVKLYACDMETGSSLTPDVLKPVPLTRCFNKSTGQGQKECLSFYCPGTVTQAVTYTGIENGISQTVSFTGLPGDAGAIRRLDISSDIIAGINRSRIVFCILFKDRNCRIKFTVDPYRQPGKTFLFINSFGAQETFTCCGDLESERKWTREYGKINREQRLTKRDMETAHTVNTGYLTREQVEIVKTCSIPGKLP